MPDVWLSIAPVDIALLSLDHAPALKVPGTCATPCASCEAWRYAHIDGDGGRKGPGSTACRGSVDHAGATPRHSTAAQYTTLDDGDATRQYLVSITIGTVRGS